MELKVFVNKLETADDCLKSDGTIELASLQLLKKYILDRVFNKDGGVATDGTPLGEYKSLSWLDKRRNKNFTNILKNLYYNGDMFNSIVTGLKGDQLGLGFNNKDIAEIARHQENSENQVDRDIFYPTIEEIELVREDLRQNIINKIRECFKT
ncbi:MAG: hypothetical protein IPG21_04680 [Saprospiraceae bacterium]|nr:hypothetical protein [Candidatus Vicinibacter affinis]